MRLSLSVSVQKFSDPYVTAKGERRAWIDLNGLETLWFNSGTLCNIECANCYIESSPKNDALEYITYDEVVAYLDEIAAKNIATKEIGITGGEPFMNPDMLRIIEEILQRGFKLLLLTNAMQPMQRLKVWPDFLEIGQKYGDQMTVRISVDHFKQQMHEEERGLRTWEPAMKGIRMLAEHDFTIDVAGRTRWGEDEVELRAGYARLFKELGVKLDAQDPKALMLFPEMDEKAEVSEITNDCWGILGVNPDDMMCASSRMVVKRKGDAKPSVMACTLLAYDQQFNMGETLEEASKSVQLNHPHCSKFCVLGGGACSATD